MRTKYGTLYVGRRAAENALHAVRYATLTGRQMNTLITISFCRLGVEDDKAGKLFHRLQANISRWWRYQRDQKKRNIGPLTGMYAHANPAGSRHVHWLIHLPVEIRSEFRDSLLKRLCKLTGLDDVGDACHVKDVDHPGGAAKYVLRGIDPLYSKYLHIRASNEGAVSCRRTGTSRSIGKAARKQAGWNRRKNTIISSQSNVAN